MSWSVGNEAVGNEALGLKRALLALSIAWVTSCGGVLGFDACREGGRDHARGETWECADGCNTCFCGDEGLTSTLAECQGDVPSEDELDAAAPDPTSAHVSPASSDAGAPQLECLPHVTHASAKLLDEAGDALRATWAWTESGLVGIRSHDEGQGVEIWRAGDTGAAALAGDVSWPNGALPLVATVAAVGSSIALAGTVLDADGRSTCQLGIVGLDPVAGLLAPSRVSDAPNASTILNESQTCAVVALETGFVVVWDQYTSDTSGEQTLFAQRFDIEGTYVGQRWQVAVGEKEVVPFAVQSNGESVLIALYAYNDAQDFYALTKDGPQPVNVDRTLIDAGGVHALMTIGQEFLAFTRDQAYLMTADGEVSSAGVTLTSTGIAALGNNLVVVEREEFLSVRTLDETLEVSSAPTILSTDRRAGAHTVVTSPGGDQVAIVFSGDGDTRLAFVECGTEATPDPDTSCALEQPLVALDDGCSEPVCHTIIRLDSINLAVRGWAVVGGENETLDAAGAAAVAEPVFSEFNEYASGVEVSGPHAGVYYTSQEPLDLGGFVLVGAQSGVVLTAGGIVWSGLGNYWLPDEWSEASNVLCGGEPVSTSDVVVMDRDCDEGDGALPNASDALDLVLRSNLAAAIAERGEFSAFSTLYTPSVDFCDRTAAEFIVVLTRR
jgi:hypothetical protein